MIILKLLIIILILFAIYRVVSGNNKLSATIALFQIILWCISIIIIKNATEAIVALTIQNIITIIAVLLLTKPQRMLAALVIMAMLGTNYGWLLGYYHQSIKKTKNNKEVQQIIIKKQKYYDI